MTLLEELQSKSRNENNARQEIVDEIVNSFRTYFNSDNFESYLRKRASDKDILAKRELKLWGEFWAYTCGCPDTRYDFGGHRWENPEHPHGHESLDYKGIRLIQLQDAICPTITNLMLNRLRELGFTILTKEEKLACQAYYNITVTIAW